jgi:hypothetical protein
LNLVVPSTSSCKKSPQYLSLSDCFFFFFSVSEITITVRRFGKTEGGEMMICPATVEELLAEGGEYLGVKAVAIQNKSKARI